MGFQSATLQFSLNGDTAVAEWRQDLAIDDVVSVSLTDNVGANSYIWRLIGRPEGSAAGGPGPEPRYLGTAQVASFTVDVKGTYTIQCLVNAGAPDALAIGGGVAILENFLAPGNRPLRLLGPGESDEDVYDPMVVQGWIKMLNRWLTKIRAGGGTTDTFKVMSDEYDDDPDYLIGKVESTDGSVVITDDLAGKRVNFVVFSKPTPSLTKRYYLTGQTSDLSREGGAAGYLLSTSNPSDEAHAVDVGKPAANPRYIWFDSPPGEPGLTSWPAGVVTANLRVRVRNAHEGLTYKLYPGDHSIVYEAMLCEVAGYYYQIEPYPAAPVLTSSYQTFSLPLYVTELSGSSARRLRADVILQVTGGALTDEVFEVRCGGDNASYFDTLFTDSGGGTSDHQALYNRGTFLDPANAPLLAHPMSEIEPGWIQTPTTAVAVVGGLLPLASASPPVKSNAVNVTGAGPLVGVELTGKNEGDTIELFFPNGAMSITNQGTPGGSYGAIAFGKLPSPNVTINRYGVLRLRQCGGIWRPSAPWFSPVPT